MTKTVAVTKAITSLIDVETKLDLHRAQQDDFFPEWREDLPSLTEEEKKTLDRLKARYEYHRYYGPLAEGAVNLLLISPLLELAGFYEPPFQIRAEESVVLRVEEEDEILNGRIDFLIVHHQLWVVVIESKRSTTDLELAIPQTLTYMIAAAKRGTSASPASQKPLYGLITTGGLFCFLKLSAQGHRQYDFSDTFSLLPRKNKLFEVLKILKKLSQLIQDN
ncbi:MAG: type I restriction endonuclease subunit R [Symploca sp. SIO1B1]|nr:type I restriction endonuclease subunit R [Symploca sp. SIO1B1]